MEEVEQVVVLLCITWKTTLQDHFLSMVALGCSSMVELEPSLLKTAPTRRRSYARLLQTMVASHTVPEYLLMRKWVCSIPHLHGMPCICVPTRMFLLWPMATCTITIPGILFIHSHYQDWWMEAWVYLRATSPHHKTQMWPWPFLTQHWLAIFISSHSAGKKIWMACPTEISVLQSCYWVKSVTFRKTEGLWEKNSYHHHILKDKCLQLSI